MGLFFLSCFGRCDRVTHVLIMIHQLLLVLLQGPRVFEVAILHEVDSTALQVCLTDLESVVPLLELRPDCSGEKHETSW